MRGVRTTFHSTIRRRSQRRRKCAAVTPECSRTQQGEITGATTKPGSKAFQGCVAKKLIPINFPKFAAPRMGAEYTFSFD